MNLRHAEFPFAANFMPLINHKKCGTPHVVFPTRQNLAEKRRPVSDSLSKPHTRSELRECLVSPFNLPEPEALCDFAVLSLCFQYLWLRPMLVTFFLLCFLQSMVMLEKYLLMRLPQRSGNWAVETNKSFPEIVNKKLTLSRAPPIARIQNKWQISYVPRLQRSLITSAPCCISWRQSPIRKGPNPKGKPQRSFPS